MYAIDAKKRNDRPGYKHKEKSLVFLVTRNHFVCKTKNYADNWRIKRFSLKTSVPSLRRQNGFDRQRPYVRHFKRK